MSPRHNAGKMAIGPDNNLYISVGEVDGSFRDIGSGTKAQNYEDGPSPDGRAEILRITQDGSPVGKGILGNTPLLNLYYAYGIKNSFDFTPLQGRCGTLKMVLVFDKEDGISPDKVAIFLANIPLEVRVMKISLNLI